MNENDKIEDWGAFAETAEFKSEVREAAEDSMCEVESALETAMDEVGNIIMSALESNHPELGDPYDGGVREVAEGIASDVLSEWLKRRGY